MKAKPNPTIREQIIDDLRRAGWTQYRLSIESGVTQAIISRYVSGKRDVCTETADKLAAAIRDGK